MNTGMTILFLNNVGVVNYSVFVNGTVNQNVGTATACTVTGLTANTAYVITISAQDASNNSSVESTPVSVTTDAQPPPDRRRSPLRLQQEEARVRDQIRRDAAPREQHGDLDEAA